MSSDVEIIQKTQKILGKHVKKPVLNEKLLKKPPFRFLHDVIVAVIRDTGFLKGLFNDNELNSSNFTEKDMKIAFLNKLIVAVKTITKIDLKVRASKIVAGLEPNETNLLLQAIGMAIDKKISSVEYVAQMKHSKMKKNEEKIKNSTKEKTNKKPVNNKETPKSDRNSNKDSTRRSDKDSKEKIKSNKDKKPVKKEEVDVKKAKKSPKMVDEPSVKTEIVDENVEPPQLTQEIVTNEEKTENPEPKMPENERNLSATRPKSARPKSGDRKPPEAPDLEALEMKTVPPLRPKSSLRPPSVRPSSARPGAPRLRPDSALPVHEPIPMGNINVIIENVDNIVDDEETVVIQNMVEDANISTINIDLENKGHLVEQILEQIQDVDGQKKAPTVEIDWEQNKFSQNGNNVTQLRNYVQSLTKTANPLGKLLNYLHEDIDAMHNELQMWTNMKRQLFVEIDKRNRMSAESDKPLLVHLERLQHEINKQEQEIAIVRGNILKNEARIKDILTK